MTPASGGISRPRNVLVAAAILAVAAFLSGFIPQYRKAYALQDQLAIREQRVGQLERQVLTAKAVELASLLYLEVTKKNYGIATQRATTFFDHVRLLLSDANTTPALKAPIEALAAQRDSLVAALAKPEPEVEAQARDILERTHKLTEP